MILGTQESSAGGLFRAFERCARDGGEALQLWTRSSRQWAARILDEEAVGAFRSAHAGAGRIPVAAHAPYLINLAATDDFLWNRSIDTLTEECRRAESLGVEQVIVHPGAAQAAGAEAGVRRAADALKRICKTLGTKPRVRLLLEITAGQGSCVGCSFAELAEMLHRAGDRRLGVCLDTQHMWAVGIDWSTARGYEDTFADFDRLIGLRYLEAFHLNDSRRPLGARVDRHERIGDGAIGLAPFKRLLCDDRFKDVPGYLETPPLPSGEESYAEGLRRLRSLL